MANSLLDYILIIFVFCMAIYIFTNKSCQLGNRENMIDIADPINVEKLVSRPAPVMENNENNVNCPVYEFQKNLKTENDKMKDAFNEYINKYVLYDPKCWEPKKKNLSEEEVKNYRDTYFTFRDMNNKNSSNELNSVDRINEFLTNPELQCNMKGKTISDFVSELTQNDYLKNMKPMRNVSQYNGGIDNNMGVYDGDMNLGIIDETVGNGNFLDNVYSDSSFLNN